MINYCVHLLVGMSNRPLNVGRSTLLFWRRLFAVVFTSSSLLPNFGSQPARAQVTEYCQLSSAAAQEKENLRLSALKGNQNAQTRYQNILQKQAQELKNCRTRTWRKSKPSGCACILVTFSQEQLIRLWIGLLTVAITKFI